MKRWIVILRLPLKIHLLYDDDDDDVNNMIYFNSLDDLPNSRRAIINC